MYEIANYKILNGLTDSNIPHALGEDSSVIPGTLHLYTERVQKSKVNELKYNFDQRVSYEIANYKILNGITDSNIPHALGEDSSVKRCMSATCPVCTLSISISEPIHLSQPNIGEFDVIPRTKLHRPCISYLCHDCQAPT